jgi:AAA ATPase domain
MADRNWHLITSGATFEALATTLIFFEDPKAALFGRRGKDGGQDARSGDRTRVFQAKHHEDGSAAKAIADAKKEAAKIVEYRKPSHARYEQWKGVTYWRLVTNAPFNPTDRQRWDTEVVPLFAVQGLSVDYWECANLDALLVKHPEVDRAFFQNETRAFLSLPEIRERLPLEEPFLQRTALAGFFGRENEIGQVRDFLLSDKLFLVVHGAGGIGKTRLLVEAGEEIVGEGSWQVLWANVASMASTGTWFEAIVPERPTLLLVDEPEDEQLLRVLSEQLGGRVGRAAKWKVAITVRSPKDPVLRFLFAPRMKPRVQELQIAALSAAAAERMCNDLLNSGPLANSAEEWRQDAARELSRRFSRHPVWLTLAVHVLETQGDLTKVPQTAEGLADSYLEEIVRRQQQAPSDQVLALLRWVALIGTVNRADDATVRLLGNQSGIGNETAVRQMGSSALLVKDGETTLPARQGSPPQGCV